MDPVYAKDTLHNQTKEMFVNKSAKYPPYYKLTPRKEVIGHCFAAYYANFINTIIYVLC